MSTDAGTLADRRGWMDVAPGARLLLVASTGGHLTQLAKIAGRLEVSLDSTWVTFDTPQSRSLLARYSDVRFVPYVPPRDLRGVVRTIRAVRRVAREGGYEAALSTGAGIAVALAVLPRALRRIYIESVSRVHGPSLTGRVLQRVPWVERRTQHREWASKKWPFEFTLLDAYTTLPRQRTTAQDRSLSVLVTLGTIAPYRFDAAVDAVLAALGPDDRVVWQLGSTTREGLPGQVCTALSRTELQAYAAQCDVVVSHAGVGTAVDLLDLGVHPVLLPRRAARAEHVDDHQGQIAGMLAERSLATTREPAQLTRQDLLSAADRLVVSGADLGLEMLTDDLLRLVDDAQPDALAS